MVGQALRLDPLSVCRAFDFNVERIEPTRSKLSISASSSVVSVPARARAESSRMRRTSTRGIERRRNGPCHSRREFLIGVKDTQPDFGFRLRRECFGFHGVDRILLVGPASRLVSLP